MIHSIRSPLFLAAGLLASAFLPSQAWSQQTSLPRESPDARAAHRLSIDILEQNPTLESNPFGVLVRYRPGTTELGRRQIRSAVGPGTFRRYDEESDIELVGTTVGVTEAIRRLAP